MELKITVATSKSDPTKTYTNFVLVLDNGRSVVIKPLFPQEYLTLAEYVHTSK